MKENKWLEYVIHWVGTKQSLYAHTLFFIFMLCLPLISNVSDTKSLLVLTTVVSLEAIFLNIFIQMGVNKGAEHLATVNKNVSSLQIAVETVQDTVEEVQDTVEEVQDTVEEDKDNEEESK